jgi:DNA-binding beta-propeller fold protein YncE
MGIRLTLAALAAAVLTAVAAAAAAPVPAAQATALLYVCVQDDARVAVVDMATAAVVKTIDLAALGFTATAKPHYIVVEPDGAHWYVSLIGAGRVLKFDRQDRVVGQFEMETPGMLALAGSDRLVVSRSMSAVNPPKRVAVLDRRAMTGDEVDVLFPRPHPVAVAGGFAYTASLGTNQIAVISLADQKVQIVDVAGPTHAFVQFALSPDKKTLVVSTEVSGQLLVFDLAVPAKPALRATVDLGKMVFDPVFTGDGRFVWVPVKMNNEIAVVDAAAWRVVARIKDPALQQPHQVVFSPDGRTAFVTNNNRMDHMADPAHTGHAMPGADDVARLAVVDVASRTVTKSLPLGKNLTGMGTRAR